MTMSLHGGKKSRVEGEKLGKHELAMGVFVFSFLQCLQCGDVDSG